MKQKPYWLAGLAIGPLFAWLTWAIQYKKYEHIFLAAIMNLVFWTFGPAVLVILLKGLEYG